MDWKLSWIAFCYLCCLLRLLTSHQVRADLSTHLPEGAAYNPFAGQGQPPDNTPATKFPVVVQVFNPAVLAVDEASYTVDLYIDWLLTYQDPRAFDLMNRDYRDTGCQQYCCSRPALHINALGLPTCCDGVYIPQAEAHNVRGFNLQDFPFRYELLMTDNVTINAFAAMIGTFAYAWDYSAFPFDRHFAVVEIQTAFMPKIHAVGVVGSGAGLIATDGFVVESGSSPMPDNYRPAVSSQSLPEWGVQNIWMETLNFSIFYGLDARDFTSGARGSGLKKYPVPWYPGIRIYIEIERQQRSFFILVTIVPVALITLFGFGVHSLRREAIKNRIELLALLFLSLVLLQFTLQAVLPAAYTLSLPFQLILVGYIYSFLSFMVCIIAVSLDSQWKRRAAKIARRRAAKDFKKWEQRLMGAAMLPVHRDQSMKTVLSGGCQEEGQNNDSSHILSSDLEIGSAAVNVRRRNQIDHQRMPESKLSLSKQLLSFKVEPDKSWLARQQQSWMYRVYPLRVISFFWKYIGKAESYEYCARVAHIFDTYARISLLVTYLAVAIGLCSYAASRSQQAAYAHVLKPSAA